MQSMLCCPMARGLYQGVSLVLLRMNVFVSVYPLMLITYLYPVRFLGHFSKYGAHISKSDPEGQEQLLVS